MTHFVFMGSPQFAVPTLEALARDHTLLAVFTQPDKPAGRGQQVTAVPVKQWAMAQGVPIQYVVPEEGSQIWEDDWAIAADSLSPDAAHEFLNFLLRPDVAAQEALYTRYATGNESALALLDASVRSVLSNCTSKASKA